jgi:ElaB/YqjD/DUF883 family membrane-anchored ribosome-binding protein
MEPRDVIVVALSNLNKEPAMNSTNVMTGNSAVTDVADRAHQAVDRATDKAVPVLERASTAAHRTIDKAVDVATPAADWVSTNTRELATRSTDLAETCSGYVRTRPLISLAGALTIGYLAGKMLR